MSKKLKLFLILVVACGVFAFTPPAEKYFDIAKNLDIFASLFKEVNTYYVDEVDPKKLIETGINGMLDQLDPYTDYIPEENREIFAIQTSGKYAGVGALIGIVNNKTVITIPYKGFPAYRAGLRVGDEFVEVDGKNVEGKSTPEVSTLLKGNPGTEVSLVLKRANLKELIRVKLKREQIKISNITHSTLLDGNIAYIKLDEFTPGAAKEVEDALEQLKAQGAKKLILDLRANLGGSLFEAINIANLFLPKGREVVSTKGKSPDWNKIYNTLNAPRDLEMPVAVLTSGSTASASEIVAGSLQDYDRAVLVGQKTFGKGLVQTTRQLSYNTQLKVTTAKYYIPSGRCIQALDYTHRKSNGTVERIADSLKREFLTKGGRKVFDGGGLDPDIAIQEDEFATATVELANSGLLFEYATLFCAENPNTAPKDFRLSDVEYNKFVAWVKEKRFTYTSDLEKRTQELVASAKNERYYDDLKQSLNDLQNKIGQYRNSDLMRLKSEIAPLLEEEIGFHLQLAEGQSLVSLNRDKEVLAAKKILTDEAAYKKLLTPQ
ncbi:MAG: S41 family peptidase [Bacteroidota bacterium]|nr:S41 family peptidase [Cytophagales bacterium]MCZ8070999.1 S41 family peptidase [Cytophagales bacterium]